MLSEKARVLIADVPELEGLWRAHLGRHELTFAGDLRDALRAAASGPYDLVLLGVHFDDSQMFDLLGALRARCGSRGNGPLVCVRAKPSALGPASSKAEGEAALALGADAYVDVTQEGDGIARLCRDIERVLANPDLSCDRRSVGTR
jgi:CheY-like chemotaxis protein